jgi:hypothetical protein
MYAHAVATLNISCISHYYLERGHTENEGDSMHSTIERAAKRANIYTPMQWYTMVAAAKRNGEAYKVVEMDGNMKDFKLLCDRYIKQSPKSLHWSQIKCLKVEKVHPDSLFVKYSLSCPEFTEVEVRMPSVADSDNDRDNGMTERNVSHELCLPGENDCSTLLKELPSETTVTAAKKNDLLWMCDELIIPREYHQFYRDLSVSTETLISSQTANVDISEVEEYSSSMVKKTTGRPKGRPVQKARKQKCRSETKTRKKQLTKPKPRAVEECVGTCTSSLNTKITRKRCAGQMHDNSKSKRKRQAF